MKRRERSAPIWLFSFVDLAFLLLIALTQLIPGPAKTGSEVARLELPRVAGIEPASSAVGDGRPHWQLRVHPLPGSDDPTVARLPFELIEPGTATATAAESGSGIGSWADATPGSTASTRLDADTLAARLDLLRERANPRPVLAPHRDARSEDLLVAVALLERVWTGDRGVTVEPMPSEPERRPPIAANAAPPATSASARESR